MSRKWLMLRSLRLADSFRVVFDILVRRPFHGLKPTAIPGAPLWGAKWSQLLVVCESGTSCHRVQPTTCGTCSGPEPGNQT